MTATAYYSPTLPYELAFDRFMFGATQATVPTQWRRFPVRMLPRGANTSTLAIDPTTLTPMEFEPTWLSALVSRCSRLEALPRDWDGPGSVPIKSELLREAVSLVKRALEGSSRVSAPYLVPGGDGSVQIEWHEKLGELELDLAADGSRHVWIRDHRSGDEIEGDDERATNLFSRWAARIAAVADDENNVQIQVKGSTFGTISGISIYSDNTIS